MRFQPDGSYNFGSYIRIFTVFSMYLNYYTSWKYVVKEDSGHIHSDGHPDLSDTPPPRTPLAIQAPVGRKNAGQVVVNDNDLKLEIENSRIKLNPKLKLGVPMKWKKQFSQRNEKCYLDQ